MDKPAIILITCDELNRNVLSRFGNRAIQTEHLDHFAQNATVYNRAYTVSPWCMPARCSILTGLYPHKHGAYSNFRDQRLDESKNNLFKHIKSEGYKTTLFGKCHFAPVPYGETKADQTLPYDEFRDYYMRLGLDELALQDDKQVSVWFYDDYSKEMDREGCLKPYRDLIWDEEKAKVFAFPGKTEQHPDAWVADRFLNYLDEAGDEPLFAWISFSGPHYPFDPPAEYIRQVDASQLGDRKIHPDEFASTDRIQYKSYHGGGNIDGASAAQDRGCKHYSDAYWDNLRINYNANVKLIDDKVGEILAAVQEKYGDNTLIFFTCDHGEMLGNHGLWGKHNCAYEEVWHIPMFVKFPMQSTGETTDRLVNLNDLYPTCIEAAGGNPDIAICDGSSLYASDVDRAYTFSEGEGFLAVTDGVHKYIHVQKPGEYFNEFLDLQTDPDEFINQWENENAWCEIKKLMEKVIEHMMPDVLP